MITIFQITNNNTKPYSDLCCSANLSYCKKYGYNFLELSPSYPSDYHYTWSKIFASINLIHNIDSEYYFFLDADAFIINHNITIDYIIKKMKHNISFSENGLNGGLLIATGAFLFNKKALSFFNKCVNLSNTTMSKYKRDYWFEMAVINKMYDSGYNMDVFEMNTMNSYGYIDINNPDLDNLFVYHFQGRSDQDKCKIANEVYNKYYKISK